MLNQVNLIGRLGKDPEKRNGQSGTAVTKFAIATTEKSKDKQTGDYKEYTEWHNCVTFGKLAEICAKYLVKGSLVYVSGSLRTDKYEKDGKTNYFTSIMIRDMKMLGSKSDNQNRPQQQTSQQEKPHESGFVGNESIDDIPF